MAQIEIRILVNEQEEDAKYNGWKNKSGIYEKVIDSNNQAVCPVEPKSYHKADGVFQNAYIEDGKCPEEHSDLVTSNVTHVCDEAYVNSVLLNVSWDPELLVWEASSDDLIGIDARADNFDVLIDQLYSTITNDYCLRPGTKIVIKAFRTLDV